MYEIGYRCLDTSASRLQWEHHFQTGLFCPQFPSMSTDTKSILAKTFTIHHPSPCTHQRPEMSPQSQSTAFLHTANHILFNHPRHRPIHNPSRRPTLAVAASPHVPDPSCLSSRFPTPLATPLSSSPSATNSPTHLLTIVTPHTTNPSVQLAQLSAYIANHNGALHHPRHLAPHVLEVPITLPLAADVDVLRTHLFHAARTHSADAVLQHITVARAHKKLAVFDLDSTLIAQETIDELASELNVQKEVKNITHRAMNGEIGFREALQQRVALLKGLPVQALDAVKHRVRFTPGASDLITALRALNCKTAVVSGGFHFLADYVRDAMGLDYSFANRLETDSNNYLTGRTVGPVVDAQFKEDTLWNLARLHNVSQENILAVGDGSNDLLMMHRAGLGVAFNAKPVVQDRAKCRVNQTSLKSILYLLGQSDDDIHHLLTHAQQ